MSRKTLAIATLVGTCLSLSTALAGPNPAMKKARVSAGPMDGPVTISLDNNIVGDGHLQVNPDPFGGVTSGFPPLVGNEDFYDPPGAEPQLSPTFAGNLFLYSGLTDRISLAHPTSALAAQYPNPGSFVAAVTSPLVGSDSDGDGVIDTANSTFTITGGVVAANLSVTLKQRVYKPAQGTARFRQIWTITNNAAAPIGLKIQRHNDDDILATPAGAGSWEDVAGSYDQLGCQPVNPYQREPIEPPTTPIAFGMVSGTSGYVYYAGRSGYDPDGAGPDPAMAYGTDFQIWNAYGLPASWANQTAFVGPSPAVGENPDQFPVGGVAPFDGFMGMQWTVTIPAGGSQKIDTSIFYGGRSGYQCYADANCDGTLTVADFTTFQGLFVAGNMFADCNNSSSLTVADFTCYQSAFIAGCPE